MEWYQLLSIIGIPSIISGIVALILGRGMKVRDRKQEDIRKQNEELERQNKAIMAGVQALLRDRLLQGYRHYAEKGWANYEDRQNMENIYSQYHSLGENGIMDGMRERFLSLPERQ